MIPEHLPVNPPARLILPCKAVRLIRQDNPFPAVCGAVCNKRCEDRCTRGTIDRPVAIDEIKKFLAQYERKNPDLFLEPSENGEGNQWTKYPIAVIGAGPAGLTAAWFLRKEGYPVTIFEKEDRPGGMLLNGIPNFRLEKDVLASEIELVKKMGAEIKCGVEVGKDVTIEKLREEGYKAFFIAIGLQGGRLAGVPGEDARGVESGVHFLKRVNLATGSGLSTDKTADPVQLDGDVVVVGGGNVAADVARTALRCSRGHVTMLCLEGRDEMPAAKDEVEEILAEGIELMNGWGPAEIRKGPDGNVTSIVFKKCTSVKDESGRFNPQYDESVKKEIPCSHVLMAIGQSAEWGDLLEGTKVKLRRNGTAEADPVTLQTAEPDIFVGGDINHGARFAIDAIADGREGMVSINRFVHPGQSMTIGRNLRNFIELDRDDIRIESYDNASRQTPGMRLPREFGNVDQSGLSRDELIRAAAKSFEDLRLPLSEEQVKTEANRCLKCGATTVDFNKCIGCGLCTTRCEFDAIHLTRDLPHCSDMYKAEQMMDAVKAYMPKRIMAIIKTKLRGHSEYPSEQ